MTSALFTRYRPPAQNPQGIPIIGGDDDDIGSDSTYGQNFDDSSDDLSTGLYGSPSAQAPPQPPSPTAQLTGGTPSVAANAPPPPPPSLADSAPPSPAAPGRSPYSQAPIVSQDVQNAIDARSKMQRPVLPKPSIWRQLAATLGETAIGGLTGGRKQGQELAGQIGQDIRYGPTAIRDQRQYDQQVADADAQLTAIGKGEDILTKGDERLTNADTRKTNAATRQAQLAGAQTARAAADLDARLKMQEAVTKSGGRQVAADAVPTPGTIRVPDPMDLDIATGQFKGKTVLEVPEHKGEVQITAETSPIFKIPAGTWIPAAQYGGIIEKNLEISNKPPHEGQTPVTNIDNLNSGHLERYKILHPGATELPPYLKLAPGAVKDDYDRVDRILTSTETALGVKANQDLNRTALAGRHDDAGDKSVKSAAFKAFTPALDSAERMNVMTQNYEDAVKNHDQQAMLSLLSNHLGMTMGLQKGARLTKDIIGEAIASRPWLQGMGAKFDSDGYLSGVTLTPDQMRQMVALGRGRFGQDIVKARSEAQYQGATDDGPTRVPSKATINYYTALANGDAMKAKQLAAEDGWSIK